MNEKSINRRKKRIKRLEKGFEKYKSDVRKKYKDVKFENYPFYKFRSYCFVINKPELPATIKYLLDRKGVFGNENYKFNSDIFIMPKVFSFIENSYNETFDFLAKLFNALYFQSYSQITIDYKNCIQIDVGASVFMDIILAKFFKYFDACTRKGYRISISKVKPINYERDEVKKVLFSIGAYKNIKGINIEFEGVTPFPIIIGKKSNPKLDEQRERDITKTVDYLIKCLSKTNRTLTGDAETNFYKVVGEVLQNAEEHSNTQKRYLIGFFEENKNKNCNHGVFSLAILNFGNTFYETFKNGERPNEKAIKQMTSLSDKYTKFGFFKKNKLEEETLWTLYALQDGVSRLEDWKRGNGAIRFIESFLELKGSNNDNLSKMVLVSGHTRIIFDGKYKTISQLRGKDNEEFKMMTFNKDGDIELPPDDNYVRFEHNYFPGTIILVKLKLDFKNTENL